MGVICCAPGHVPSVLKLAPQIPTLKVIVSMETLPAESKAILSQWGEQVGIKVLNLADGNVML